MIKLDRGQKELRDLLKEGVDALVQMRKGIENACTDLRRLYSKRAAQYLRRPEQQDAVTGNSANNIITGNKLFPLLPIDKSHLF